MTARQCGPSRRRGFALLLSVLLLSLMIAVSAQLVTLTSTTSVIAHRRHRSLDHQLALDSALLLVAEELNEKEGRLRLARELDRTGSSLREIVIGDLEVICRITDDAAKMNPVLLQRDDQRSALEAALRALGARLGLGSQIGLQPILEDRSDRTDRRYRWFDQLFSAPGEWVSRDALRVTWSDALSFWGDGRIAVRRVSEAVLEAALQDIRPGLARVILQARLPDRSVNCLERSLNAVDSEIRSRVARRLVFDAERFSMRVDTTAGGDRRRWYVVATFGQGQANVLHRSQLTW